MSPFESASLLPKTSRGMAGAKYAADSEGSNVQIGSNKDEKSAKSGNGMFIYVLSFFSAIGGFLFGYDTGVVSGAMLLLKDNFNLTSLEQEIIVSVTIGFAFLFALIGGWLNDRFGRKPTTVIASLVFTIGAGVLAAANAVWMLIVGRAILGTGIGKQVLLTITGLQKKNEIKHILFTI